MNTITGILAVLLIVVLAVVYVWLTRKVANKH
jgi:hypothetical protein